MVSWQGEGWPAAEQGAVCGDDCSAAAQALRTWVAERQHKPLVMAQIPATLFFTCNIAFTSTMAPHSSPRGEGPPHCAGVAFFGSCNTMYTYEVPNFPATSASC
mmetsp:Transcript_26336/g.73999  ORF Transcript_26336/g.73999 Transcript_26336/m.73999 type:complete len:104 (+) Transcript_26336:3525-3836(+)